jgi:hypothetical protein
MDVSGDWSAGRDPFSDVFWTVLFDTLLHVFCQLVRCLLHAVSTGMSDRLLAAASWVPKGVHQVAHLL